MLGFFPTNMPIVPGHILISPIRHVAKFEDLNAEEVNAIFDLFKESKNALVKSFGAEGFNIAWNENKIAGQSVPHFHMHLLPRKDGDTGIMEYEPRKFLYRTGERETTPEEELSEIVELIKRNI
jgi:diadenosine tetraphosphate (Ap4A) HIT family hydrolase